VSALEVQGFVAKELTPSNAMASGLAARSRQIAAAADTGERESEAFNREPAIVIDLTNRAEELRPTHMT
jgi:hypothetical protein